MELWISFIPFGLSLASLIISYFTLSKNTKLTREGFRERRETSIIAWGDQAIDVLCHCESLCRLDSAVLLAPEFAIEKEGCLRTLSALIDRGRWYFPNIDNDSYGLTKELAYRGHRQPILDYLVWAHDALKGLAHDDPKRAEVLETLVGHKRAFVAEVQSKVDVRRRVEFSELMMKA